MKFKILVIDDEQSIRDIFSLLLGEKGYAVETAAQRPARACGKARAFVPDVVLLDMNLPDMSGLDVLAGLREALPGLPGRSSSRPSGRSATPSKRSSSAPMPTSKSPSTTRSCCC